MTDATDNTRLTAPLPADEINVLELVYVLVKYKTVIILFTVAAFVLGVMAARAKGPTYIATASIITKDTDRLPAANLGAFGMFAAGSFNLAGNPGLDKIEIHLDSRRFKAELIEKYGLRNDIYKFGAPRLFRNHYDTIAARWIESENFREPTTLQAAELLGKSFFQKEVNTKKGMLTLTVKSSDSLFTRTVIEAVLEHLNDYIRADVLTDAKNNVNFLETQLITIADPLLREKLQGMIALEIEKMMTISMEAFKVIDRPFGIKKYRERIMYPILFALGMFMAVSLMVIFFYYVFGGGNTNNGSKRWVGMIRRQVFRI